MEKIMKTIFALATLILLIPLGGALFGAGAGLFVDQFLIGLGQAVFGISLWQLGALIGFATTVFASIRGFVGLVFNEAAKDD